MKSFRIAKILVATAILVVLICFHRSVLSKRTVSESAENGNPVRLLPDEDHVRNVITRKSVADDLVKDAAFGLAGSVKKWRWTMETDKDILSNDSTAAAAERNDAANELFSLSELPDGIVGDLTRMFRSTDEDEVWRDFCLQFLGSALERTDGVADADRTLARETLVEALSSTNATFAGTALRALRRVDPSDPLVASNALRIARDPSYPSSSRTTALLILEECLRTARPVTGPQVAGSQVAGPQVAGPKSILPDNKHSTSSTLSTSSTPSTPSTLAEIATAISADPSASPLLRRTADAVARRHAADAD